MGNFKSVNGKWIPILETKDEVIKVNVAKPEVELVVEKKEKEPKKKLKKSK